MILSRIYSLSHVSLGTPKWNAHCLVLSEPMPSVQQVLKSAGERFVWEESRGSGRRNRYFLHGPRSLPPLSLLLFSFSLTERVQTPTWEGIEGEKGPQEKTSKSVYLVSCCSGTRLGTLNLLYHKSNSFPFFPYFLFLLPDQLCHCHSFVEGSMVFLP